MGACRSWHVGWDKPAKRADQHGVGDAHAEIEMVEDRLQNRGDDPCGPRCAEHQHRPLRETMVGVMPVVRPQPAAAARRSWRAWVRLILIVVYV